MTLISRNSRWLKTIDASAIKPLLSEENDE